jgi:sigma-B regulation protein RsbU (phosphoserine phosphatase)
MWSYLLEDLVLRLAADDSVTIEAGVSAVQDLHVLSRLVQLHYYANGVPEPAELSEAVQRALLPHHLPEIPGWSVSTLYQPADKELLVGGDFYDWYERPDGSFGVIVGDVSGKGSIAAALGMSIRKGLKALSFVMPTIEESVEVLETALADEIETTFVSFGYIEVGAGPTARLLSVGHPAPWLIRDGAATEVSLPSNALFGLRDLTGSPRSSAVEVELQSGDLLLLFSDGLTDARLGDGRRFGEEFLQQALSGLPHAMRSWQLILRLSSWLERTGASLDDDLVLLSIARD